MLLQKRIYVLLILMFVFVLTSCSNKPKVHYDEYFQEFNGKLLSVVNQKDNKYNKDLGVLYTVTVSNTTPSMKEQFKEYNVSNQANDDLFAITNRTIIFKQVNQTTKQLISAEELELNRGHRIQCWIQPMTNHPYNLEAIEVMVY